MAIGSQQPSQALALIEQLKGANERAQYNNPDVAEFDRLVGWIHQETGSLQRIYGDIFLQQHTGLRILSLHQLFDDRKNVIVQTDGGIFRYSEDEILRRPNTTNLTPVVIPEEDTMSEALIAATFGSGTNGGGYGVASTWTDAPLNVIVHQRNADGTAAAFVTALAANVFTLAAGIYRIEFETVAHRTAAYLWKSRLFNVTTGLPAWNGAQNEESLSIAGSANNSTRTRGQGFLDLSGGSAQFKIQHWMDTVSAGVGFGFPVTTGKPEVYRTIKILKTG